MRRHYKLTAAAVKAAKTTGKQYRICDGGGFGLALNVSKAGTKSWTQRLVIRGVRRDIGLGSCNFLSLKDARFLAFENAKVARIGGDPRQGKIENLTFAGETMLGGEPTALEESTRTESYWRATMAQYVLPRIGTIPIADVSQKDIRHALLPIAEAGKLVLAKTIGWRISQVLEWARAGEFRRASSPVSAVLKSLPKRKTPVKHHKALHFSEVGDALDKVDATQCYEGVKLALRFMVLTAARSIEVRKAEWGQADMESRIWHVPAASMKSGRNHDVPLSDAAVELLKRAREIGRGGDFIFTGVNGRKIGERTIRAALQDYGKVDATPHGMRSAFKEFCRDREYSDEMSELALAHTVGDSTRSAYARSELTEKRRRMMEDWSQHLSKGKEPTLDKWIA